MEFSGERTSKNEAIELALAKLLRIGAAAAASLVAAGIIVTIFGLTALGGNLVNIGLLALVATPIMRVTVAGIVFLRERDWLFASFCLAVLGFLIIGMLIGKVE